MFPHFSSLSSLRPRLLCSLAVPALHFISCFAPACLHPAPHHAASNARAQALTGTHDLVCYGHDHIFLVERIGSCLLINPGDLLGKDAVPTFVLLDTDDLSVRQLEVGCKLLLDD